MKRVVLSLVLSMIPAVAMAAADPELARMSEDQPVRVLVLAHPRAMSDRDAAAALAGANVAEGNEKTFLRQEQARRDLAGVREALGARASDVEVLWIVDGVAATVPAGLARELAARSDVRDVLVDRRIQWIHPVKPAGVAPLAPLAWGPKRVHAQDVWKDHGAYGQGVTIGVIDTGADGQHRDLAGKVVRFRNFTKITAPEEPAFDDEGHGTHCSGIIAGGNASGADIGVAPRVRLIVGKGLDKNGGGGPVGLIRALQWMCDPDGSNATKDQPIAVSCSWGANLNLPVVSRLFWLSISALRDAGVLPIVASGNEGPNKLSVPGSYPHSFAVGAIEQGDKIADFTSRGTIKWGSTTYIKPNISAPGDFIYSSVPGGKYEYLSGTSMATPMVAGCAALLKNMNKNLSAAQIESILARTVFDLGAPGEDTTFGKGLVDAKAAAVAVNGGRTALPAIAELIDLSFPRPSFE